MPHQAFENRIAEEAELKRLREESAHLREVITVHADLFDRRAERCEAKAIYHEPRHKVDHAYWSGRAQVYRVVAFTLRSQL